MLLPELLSKILKIEKRPVGNENGSSKVPGELDLGDEDNNVVHPDKMMLDRGTNNSKTIYDDNGNFSLDQSPFAGLKDMLAKSRADNNSGPGLLKQLLGSLLQGSIVPNTGTVGGDPAGISPPSHTPGTRQDAALNPQPLKSQRQPGLAETTPLPQARPDYSQPSALDPVAIEQLRTSLLTDAGQLDPNNPNGLSGRMSSPNANADMNNQRQEAMSIEDDVRGFNGVKSARMKKGN